MAGTVAEALEVAEAQRAERELPGVSKELESMEHALVKRVFDAISDKTLTHEQAYFAWLEMMQLRQLGRKLRVKVKMGQVALAALVKSQENGGK